NRIGIELDPSVGQETRQAIPPRQRISDRIGELPSPRDAAELLLKPDLQLFNQRLGERSPLGHAERRRLATDALLDRIELSNSPQCLGCNGRVGCLEEFIEVASRMDPTCSEGDVAACLQSLETGIAIDMEHPREVLQMRRWSCALAIGREYKDCSRRCRAAPRPLVTCVHPKPSGLGAAATRIKHRHWRVVSKQMIRRKDVGAESFVQCVKPPACTTDPSGQRRTIEINAETRKDLRLSVQRRVIAIFADQDLCEQRWRRQAARDRPLRRWRLRHSSATATTVFGTANADDAELRRYPVQHLADALSDRMQRATATCAARGADVD